MIRTEPRALASVRSCLLFALLLAVASGVAAESKPIRLAVAPFFAPVGNPSLVEASTALPELLMATLSRQQRFQLVERDKVQLVWGELHLNTSGLVARESVAKLGRMVECDWVVSGSFVQTEARTQVWTKIIDVRNGVVLDLHAASFSPTNFGATIDQIAAFLASSSSTPKARQFITLGRFVDMNPSLTAGRVDWSRRIPALIERHFHSAGYGVAELEAVRPIFEEYRLETAGLTGNPNERVKLQPAFWIVDGGCEWLRDAPDQVSVQLRVQKPGSAAQMLKFIVRAGEELERTLVQKLQDTVTSMVNVAPQNAAKAEADLQTARGEEMATLRSPFRQAGPAQANSVQEQTKSMDEHRKRFEENRRVAIATWERTILLDPKNLEAKNMLGYALLGDADPLQRERGKQLLREIVATKDPKYVERAQRHLDNADFFARHAESLKQPTKP